MDVPAYNLRHVLRPVAVSAFCRRLGQGPRTQPPDSLGSGPPSECRIALTLLLSPPDSSAVDMDDEVCEDCCTRRP